ncbi:hypothetical protein [Bradyrhizobium sp. NP1]|uniref:hypothetical protein n=1 Tax=Bradyrhizobium sp. NP1 TaxID=3049772 RepID=UPI0025A548E8|nr:hypothetical protein [Bradyrhizobium sp. NP1]WJR79666.1 hypothetical protein QOU61_07800 [Bradyrhizobium sp. NP1]
MPRSHRGAFQAERSHRASVIRCVCACGKIFRMVALRQAFSTFSISRTLQPPAIEIIV